MYKEIKRALIRFMIFALGGLVGEVFAGAITQLSAGNWNLHGTSSLWMMIDYGLFGLILMPLTTRMVRWRFPLPVRAFFYMLLIFAVEYVSGIIFTRGFGLHIWSYTGMSYNLHGQIALYCVPIWYTLGLLAEYLYRKVDAVAGFLVYGQSKTDNAQTPCTD